MPVDIIGIIFIAILLIFVLVGVSKGFFWCLSRFLKLFGTIIISTFLCKPLGKLLHSTPIGNSITSSIAGNLIGQDAAVFGAAPDASTIDAAEAKLKIPAFLRGPFNQYIVGTKYDGFDTVAKFFGNAFSMVILVAISFIVLVIACAIVCVIFRKLGKFSQEHLLLNVSNRVLGGILNLAFGLMVVWGICFALSALMSMENGLTDWLRTTMRLNDDTFSISKIFYSYNPIASIVYAVFGI
ncbi:MAG: CvpA family protein [Bacilli bacterium]|nr:CvpA family protein [Bacilli bacterium]